MAAYVEVLCPSGHRQKIKTNPNTKILQILEEVCTKKGFLPAEEYELKHGRKSLDVTLNVRFAGLPNNAKLELIKAQKVRSESEVMIALQLDGARLQQAFAPGTSLWHILTHWENQPDSDHKDHLTKGRSAGLHPVCTYMREEVVGEFALRETTLRTLGLTGGRAMLRLSHRQVDQNLLDDIKAKIEGEKSRQAKLLARAMSNESNRSTHLTPSSSSSDVGKPPATCDVPMDTEQEPEVSTRQKKSNIKSRQKTEPMDAEVTSERDQPMEEVVTSGAQAARDGTLVQGMMQRQRQEGSLRMLENMPGVQVIRPTDFDELSSEQQQEARQMAANVFPGLFGSNRGTRPKLAQQQSAPPIPVPNPFANFKFPESTKGKDLYHNELSEVQKEEFLPCDREACLYCLDEVQETEAQATGGSDELPDDFFEVTVSDVQRMYSDLQKNVTSIGEGALVTSSMRQAAAEERMSHYPRVIIRIQFHDRLVLQGVFRPRETVFALKKFVKEHIQDKRKPFYLYTTPPKSVLNDNAKTLYEANLVPMTVVYFGSESKKEHNLSNCSLYKVGARSIADRIVYNHMADKSGEGSSDLSWPRPKRTGHSADTSSTGDQPKVPKWFKVGKMAGNQGASQKEPPQKMAYEKPVLKTSDKKSPKDEGKGKGRGKGRGRGKGARSKPY